MVNRFVVKTYLNSTFTNDLKGKYFFFEKCSYRRMAENGFAPPLGNFVDISYLVEN